MAKVTRKANKAALVKELRDKQIPIPENPTIENLTSRLSWLGGKGWIVRLFKPHPEPSHPANLLEQGVMTYIPNSRFAEKIVKSQKVMIVARTPMPWDGVPILEPQDITEDEEE
tara:strand:+ start:795 stop:1136 length:342 start_codon:yes stop_codon:yes gene_type:complete